MNKLELARMLTHASIIDNRKVLPETVEAWHPIVGHVDYDVAIEAIETHFAESKEYLMPSHIVAGAARVRDRRDRMGRRAQGAIVRKQITLDRQKFEAETQAALEATRAAKLAAVEGALAEADS